jgi:BirA family transcriptional regulator, biotin operon repressor / biotin---[acetyl-CoA-carboxylase] ligase
LPDHSPISPLGQPLVELASADSTNNYARQQIHAALAQHGMTIFANDQTAGKGQRGKVWIAEKGANIAVSVIINPQPLRLSQQFELSACAAVALHDFFSAYAGEDAKIKWPNDLYWQDRKAGGILIESVVGSRQSTSTDSLHEPAWQWAIAGIGININQTSFPKELHNPVSLKQITGKSHDPLTLAKELCAILDKKYSALLSPGGFKKIYEQYLSCLYKKDRIVKLKKDNRVFEATIQAVSPTGKLKVVHAIEEEFDFGEVEWVT